MYATVLLFSWIQSRTSVGICNMKICKFLLYFITIFGLCEAKEYELVICSIFKNEAPWLKEWIDYHLYNGVDKFYLYNHMSDDNYQEVLDPYIKEGTVELIDWLYPEWPKAQLDAMKDAIRRIRKRAKWAAMIDVDEFIVCNRRKITCFLEPYHKHAGLSMNWLLFGTGGISDLHGRSLIETILLRSEIWYDEPKWNSNRFVKCIIRPDRINENSKYASCGNHIFEPIEGFIIVNEHHIPQFLECQATGVSVDKIQLNHYWFRDEKWFYETKIKRREETGYQYDSDLLKQMVDDCNQMVDLKILKHLPRK